MRLPLLLVAALLAAAPAIADEKPSKKAPAAADRHDPDNVRGLSAYIEALNKGVAKYIAKDYPGALDLFRAAIPLAPKNALGHYFIAETQIATGNLPDAEATLKQAEALTDDKNAGLRAKVLFVTADTKERLKKWDEAKAAWQAYVEYAQKHADVAFAQSGTSRIQALDDMLKQEKAYVAVRERIAAEKSAPPPGSTPTPSPTLPKK
jgi:tetratricopeptide (TPR) repeat protein